eukprot:GHVS01054026.1.p1 GENE.GHVS01054026.1~~GHVS01054026.1.p1  ORF type:complete len:204 (+),score=41.86 GHVS01054026.1:502-1113(+)
MEQKEEDKCSRGGDNNEQSENVAMESPATTTAATTTCVEDNENLVESEIVKRFIFPTDLQHPNTTGRLYLFAMHGSPNSLTPRGTFRSGRLGSHELTHSEVKLMIAEMFSSTIRNAIQKRGGIREEQMESELQRVLLCHRYSKKEVDKLLSGCADVKQTTKQLLLCFRQLQQVVLRKYHKHVMSCLYWAGTNRITGQRRDLVW